MTKSEAGEVKATTEGKATAVRRGSAPRPRSRRRGERTRTLILDKAQEIFAAKGFEATTLGEIAGAAGIRAPSLYEYFGSKEQLYEAMLARACEPLFDILDRFVKASEDRPNPRPNLLEDFIEVFSSRPYLPRLMHQEALTGAARLQPILSRMMETLFGRAIDALDRIPSGGRWTRDEIPFVALAMMHVCTCYFSLAPLYQGSFGLDLLSADVQERHSEFLRKFWRMLWFEGPPAGSPALPAG